MSFIAAKLQQIQSYFFLLEEKHKQNPRKVQSVYAQGVEDLESLLDILEERYYEHFIQDTPIEALEKELERNIAITKRTMNTFLPLMIAYNMVVHSVEQEQDTGVACGGNPNTAP